MSFSKNMLICDIKLRDALASMECVRREILAQNRTFLSIRKDVYFQVLGNRACFSLDELKKHEIVVILQRIYTVFFSQIRGSFYKDDVIQLFLELCHFHKISFGSVKSRDLCFNLIISLFLQYQRKQKLRKTGVYDRARLPSLHNPLPRLVVIYPSFLVKNKSLLNQFLQSPPLFITFPLEDAVIRLRLEASEVNEDPSSCGRLYTCYTCHVSRPQPWYKIEFCKDGEATGVQNTASLEEEGDIRKDFNLCIICAFYFYCLTSNGLSRVINEVPRRFRVSPDTGIYMVHLSSKDDTVIVKFRLKPRGAHPIVWIAKKGMNQPPASWRSKLKFVSSEVRQRSHDGYSTNEDACLICRESLKNGKVVWQAVCGHCVHENCWRKLMLRMMNKCPLCHQKDFLTRGIKLSNNLNEFEVHVKRPDNRKKFVLVIGALISLDGQYHNYTNISACRSLYINHPCSHNFNENEENLINPFHSSLQGG
ncbi:uncharacterized protein TM35_000054390 [Trypanosoma theileri]|uniref:RING-type domain-containing protein n=1 Tax=Trypanosoma theileri TaxID=67003 RepID=A0A1X0P5B5_9TRYP|nr:uncharacterized protein TM35_000054390 [Trypanosoma theileri]ORC91843.1 hypothetical protein TM35_000054390 [Trypanosoma theileri]